MFEKSKKNVDSGKARKKIAPAKKIAPKKAVKKESKEDLTKEFNRLYALIDESKRSGNREEALKYGVLLNKLLEKLK